MIDHGDGGCACLREAVADLDLDDTVDLVVGPASASLVERVDAAVAAGVRRLIVLAETPLPLHAGGDLERAAAVGMAAAGVRNAAVRLAPTGTANVVLVGPLDLGERCGPDCLGVDPEHRATIEAESITGKLSTVDQVVAAVRFLASTEADYVSGIVMPVDGGLSAGRYA